MIEFRRKFENRGIKIAPVISILITKSINLQLFTLILYGVGVRYDRRRFSVNSPFIEMVCAEFGTRDLNVEVKSLNTLINKDLLGGKN